MTGAPAEKDGDQRRVLQKRTEIKKLNAKSEWAPSEGKKLERGKNKGCVFNLAMTKSEQGK